MFRNESDAIVGKAKAKEIRKEKGRAIASETSIVIENSPKSDFQDAPPKRGPISLGWATEQTPEIIPDVDHETLQRQIKAFVAKYTTLNLGEVANSITPTYSLPPTLDERSKAYFYTNSSMWLRNFDLLGSLYSQSNTDQYLLASMSAVGLAGLSNAIRAPELMLRAQKDYVTALRLTNLALRSPTCVKKDSTLLSVMILSIFETITGTDTKSLSAWTKHINGAAALVKLRGTQQFSTESGQRMFLQIFSSLMLSCIQRTIALPEDIVELRSEAAKHLDPTKPGWKLSGVIVDFSIFRAAVRDRKMTSPREIVEKALELDRRLTETHADLPVEFKFQTVISIDQQDVVWDGYYHKYDNYWAAQIWNGMRICRILLHETIQEQIRVGSLAPVPVFTDAEVNTQNAKSITILLQLQADILASVPQHLAAANGLEQRSLLDASLGYFILWPLYVVGIMELTTEPLKKWVVNRLHFMADSVGISQARVLASHIMLGREIPDWDFEPNVRRPLTLMDRVMAYGGGRSIVEV
jgi:hypothetical protein